MTRFLHWLFGRKPSPDQEPEHEPEPEHVKQRVKAGVYNIAATTMSAGRRLDRW